METPTIKTIGQIVADDYRAAAIFKKYHIDFCCNGNRTIESACQGKLDPETLMKELETLEQTPALPAEFAKMNSRELTDYIESRHHKYVEEAIAQIKPFLKKVVSVHGSEHPELAEIENEFTAAAGELSMHMKKEELILFPFIRKMEEALETGVTIQKPHFGSVANPVSMMEEEHSVEGERFERISRLSKNYTLPADACTTYRVTYALLQEFQEDLHQHIHLENNILFPIAKRMENELFNQSTNSL